MPKATKEKAREWMQERQRSRKPVPDLDEIRRQLGIDLVEAEREVSRDVPVKVPD